jgi:uncharacterized caspase-like protein
MNARSYEVRLALEDFFADRRPDELLLVHFSCHGVKDESGRLFFAAADTQKKRLNATAIAAEYVNDLINRTRSRQVVLYADSFPELFRDDFFPALVSAGLLSGLAGGLLLYFVLLRPSRRAVLN